MQFCFLQKLVDLHYNILADKNLQNVDNRKEYRIHNTVTQLEFDCEERPNNELNFDISEKICDIFQSTIIIDWSSFWCKFNKLWLKKTTTIIDVHTLMYSSVNECLPIC